MASKAALPISENQMSKVNAENGQIQTNGSDAVLGSGEISKEINEINSQVELHKGNSKKLHDLGDDMIPDELLYSLTHFQQGGKKEKELAPIKEVKTPEKIKMLLKKGPPSNVWHHKARRMRFKHLTDNPRSMGKGVGTRDVSFLYDVVHQAEPVPPSLSKLDKSAVRAEAISEKKSAKIAVPDSIIPEEYHMVKSKAVLGLEYIDEALTTLATDHEQTLRVFPSLKPNKRFEVIQLLQTLEAMLEESGVRDDSVEVKGPTQIHNLLELIKKEQNIYDLVFSEVIRQVSVECVERGQLLSQLRQNYAELLNRIPRQIQSLHAEVMAQRSLDRRLTEELVRFKSSITFLTKELQTVREHDQHVTMEAQMAEEELAKALKESQTNANLVDEYHSLYELQRKRLEASVSDLTTEKDLWSNAAYSLALKITNMNSLNTAKRLHVSEKAWSKLANHFAVMLNDYDSQCLADVQRHVEKWRVTMFQFKQELESSDKKTKDLLVAIREGLYKWIKKYDDTLVETQGDAQYIKEPPADFVSGLCEFFKTYEEKMGVNGERFAGGMLLSNEERITFMAKESNAWTEAGWDIYRRHKTDSGDPFPLCETMKDINVQFHDLSKQLQIRFSGENGVARALMNIQNAFDGWTNKLTLQMLGSDSLTDSEWISLRDRLNDYVAMINDAINLVGSQQLDEDRSNNLRHEHIDIDDVMKNVHEWIKATVKQIEAEDGKMMARVSSLHIDLVRWMVQMLLNLVPNYDPSRRGSYIEPSMATIWSKAELVENAQSVTDHLTEYTDYSWKCCIDIVQTTMQAKKDHGDDDADYEYRDFLRVKTEAAEWIRNCEFLLNSILSNPLSLLTAEMSAKLHIPQEDVAKQSTTLLSKDSLKRRPTKRNTNTSSGLSSDDEKQSPSKTSVEKGRQSPQPEKPKRGFKVTTPAVADKAPEREKADEPESAEDSEKPAPVKEDDSSLADKKSGGRKSPPKTPGKKTRHGKGKKVGGKGAKASPKFASEAFDPAEEVTTGEEEEEEEEAEVTKESDGQVELDELEKEKQVEKTLKDQFAATQDQQLKADDGPIVYQKLGEDDNIHEATIEDPNGPFEEGDEEDESSDLMKSAYEAIANMDSLQSELLKTEIRAQNAEKKAIDLQELLNQANQKIRSLERAASAANHDSPHDQTPEDGAEGADKEQSGKDSSVGKRDDIESKDAKSSTVDSAKRKGQKGPKPKKPAGTKKK